MFRAVIREQAFYLLHSADRGEVYQKDGDLQYPYRQVFDKYSEIRVQRIEFDESVNAAGYVGRYHHERHHRQDDPQ